MRPVGHGCYAVFVVTASHKSLGLLLIALVASVGLNAWLLLHGTDPPAEPDAARAAAPSTTAEPTAAGVAARDPRCPPLGRQQTARMLRLLLASSQEREAATDEAEAPEAGARRLADEATRREVLCRVGEVAARNDWNAKRDDLVASVRESLADDARQEREMADDAVRMAEAVGLDDDQRALLTDRYRELRAARMDQLADALEGEEIDFKGAFDAFAGLYQDEDRLVGELFGDDSREKLHDYEIDKRATILAIAATYAELSWFDSITW